LKYFFPEETIYVLHASRSLAGAGGLKSYDGSFQTQCLLFRCPSRERGLKVLLRGSLPSNFPMSLPSREAVIESHIHLELHTNNRCRSPFRGAVDVKYVLQVCIFIVNASRSPSRERGFEIRHPDCLPRGKKLQSAPSAGAWTEIMPYLFLRVVKVICRSPRGGVDEILYRQSPSWSSWSAPLPEAWH